MTTGQNINNMPIEELQPNPLQPRGVITSESINDLVDSIKEHGILEPLVAAHTPAGYQIIAGERRWRAAKLAGLNTVPVLIKETTPQGMLEMAIVENVQRTDLNAIDRAKAFERLSLEFGLSTSEIAKRVSKSSAYVSNTLRLLKLPDALKDGLLTGIISEGHARALAAIDDEKSMVEAYKQIMKESGSVRRAEEVARRFKKSTGKRKRKVEPKVIIVDEKIDKMQEDLTKKLGDNVTAKLVRTRVETRLTFKFKGSLENTDPQLENVFNALMGS